jgi:hypothetical protein
MGRFKNLKNTILNNKISSLIICFIVVEVILLLVLFFSPEYGLYRDIKITDSKLYIAIQIVAGVIGVLLLIQRNSHQEKQNKISQQSLNNNTDQVKNAQDTLKQKMWADATKQLTSTNILERQAGITSLVQLASNIDNTTNTNKGANYTLQIFNILCQHIIYTSQIDFANLLKEFKALPNYNKNEIFNEDNIEHLAELSNFATKIN